MEEKFDIIVLFHVIEHMDNPEFVLNHLKKFLSKGGIIAATVPNAMALSRQLAVEMGLLKNVYELTQNDINHGHTCVFDFSRFRKLFEKCRYEITGESGLAFKLFCDRQNDEIIKNGIIGEPQMKSLWKIADRYKDLSGAIMCTAKPLTD